MNALIILIDHIVNLYIWTMLAYIVITWLIAFRIINPWQPIVRMAMDFLGRIHEPLMSRVRRFLPDLGGIDLSPIILLLAVQFRGNCLLFANWPRGEGSAAMSLAVNKTAQTCRDIPPRRFACGFSQCPPGPALPEGGDDKTIDGKAFSNGLAERVAAAAGTLRPGHAPALARFSSATMP